MLPKGIEEIVEALVKSLGEKKAEDVLLTVHREQGVGKMTSKRATLRMKVAESLLDLGDALGKEGLDKDQLVLEKAAGIFTKVAGNELMQEVDKAQADAKSQYGDQSQDALYKYKAASVATQKKLAAIKDLLEKAAALQKKAEAMATDIDIASKGDQHMDGGGKEGGNILDVKQASKQASALDKAYNVAMRR